MTPEIDALTTSTQKLTSAVDALIAHLKSVTPVPPPPPPPPPVDLTPVVAATTAIDAETAKVLAEIPPPTPPA